MADFDKIHGVPGPYQKPCKQLLDGMPAELVADNLLRPILSTLKRYGDDCIAILLEVSTYLKQLSMGPLFSSTIDWAASSKTIDQMIRQSSGGNKRGLSTIRRVAKRQLQELQSGVYTLKDMPRTLLRNYIAEILKDCFEDPVKRLLLQSEGVCPERPMERLAQLWPHLLPKIDKIVEQVVSSRSVASIRKPRRVRGVRVVPANVSNIQSVYTEDLDAITL